MRNTKENMLTIINGQLTQSFVGEKYPYYKRKWERIVAKKFFSRINWWAFILGPIWYAYRKMYVPLFVLVTLIALSVIIDIYFNINIPGIVFSIVVGMTANDLYLLFVRANISKLKAEIKDEDLLHKTLKKKGGISMFAASAATLTILVALIPVVIDLASHHN